jgi:sulfonate transport system permease protein
VRRGTELSLAIGVPLLHIVLWQVASSRNWIDSHLYPSPSEIVKDARRLVKDGTLQHDLWVSTRRILYGYLIGTASGIIVGFITGAQRLVRAALEPLLSSLYTVPKLALLPIFLTVFGFGEKAIVMLIATTVFFFVWISTMAAVIGVAEGYREAAQSFGVSSWQMFRHVLWPASLPAIFVGMRIAAGVSVLMLIGVEFVIADDGLGYLIEQGRTLLLVQQTYVGIVCAALLGLVFTWVVRLLARVLTPWSKPDNTADMI